jgi:hypothetical protein
MTRERWLAGTTDGAEKILESDAVLLGRHQRGLLVTNTVDWEELLGGSGGAVDGLAERKGNHRVLRAMDNEDRRRIFVKASDGIQLTSDE